MTIYSDAIGNKFLGDCIYANHDINYPNTPFLIAHPYSTLSAELVNLCSQSGLKFRNVASQSLLNVSSSIFYPIMLCFGADSDTIDDRYAFGFQGDATGGGLLPVHVVMYNNSGATYTDNNENGINRVISISGNTNPNIFLGESMGYSLLDSQCVGVADKESLCLFFYQINSDKTLLRTTFYYAGTLAEVNTNFDYYSQSQITKSILFSSRANSNDIRGGHWIAENSKQVLMTGKAEYLIVCADGQLPSKQWASPMYVFDNDEDKGYPAIGRVRNLLLATGTYTIGKPVKIQGAVFPDAGFNRWLPVGLFGGKTVLMRCYSSVLMRCYSSVIL